MITALITSPREASEMGTPLLTVTTDSYREPCAQPDRAAPLALGKLAVNIGETRMEAAELVTRARMLSAMISLGEGIHFGEDSAMLNALADRVEKLADVAGKALPLIAAANREESTNTEDWQEVEAMIREAIGRPDVPTSHAAQALLNDSAAIVRLAMAAGAGTRGIVDALRALVEGEE